MIGKMLLNRTNRVYIRKRREVKIKATHIQSMLLSKQKILLKRWKSNQIQVDEFQKEMEALKAVFDKFQSLDLLKI